MNISKLYIGEDVPEIYVCKECGYSTDDERRLHYTAEFSLCDECCNCSITGTCEPYSEEE